MEQVIGVFYHVTLYILIEVALYPDDGGSQGCGVGIQKLRLRLLDF
jgi:hypothetical protein